MKSLDTYISSKISLSDVVPICLVPLIKYYSNVTFICLWSDICHSLYLTNSICLYKYKNNFTVQMQMGQTIDLFRAIRCSYVIPVFQANYITESRSAVSAQPGGRTPPGGLSRNRRPAASSLAQPITTCPLTRR